MPKQTRPGKGRPCKLTPELHAEIVKWLEVGNYIETAASLAGIDKKSIYTWLKRGHQEKKGIFRDFLYAVKKAEAKSETIDLMTIRRAAEKNWQAAAWRLERKYPKKWGRKTETAIKVVDRIIDKNDTNELTDSELESIVRAGARFEIERTKETKKLEAKLRKKMLKAKKDGK